MISLVDEQDLPAGSVPPRAAPARYRRLLRRVDRGVVAGVAAGLGDYFAVDPVLFRVGFVALTITGGVGVFLYLLAWWTIPPAGPIERAPMLERLARWLTRGPSWVAVALVVAGGALAARQIGVWHPALFWGVALIALGVVLFRSAGTRSSLEPVEEIIDVDEEQADPSTVAPSVETETIPPRRFRSRRGAPSSPPRRRRERSPLGWITVGALLLVVGVAAAIDEIGLASVAPVTYAGLALGVIALGLLVGGWWGRARWLILPGMLLVPVVFAASLILVPLQGGYGRREVRIATATEVGSPYRLIAGTMVLDLAPLRAQQPVRLVASVGVGTLTVLLPPGAVVRVHAESGGGSIDVLGQTVDGLGVSLDRSFAGSRRGPELILDLRTGLGGISVFGQESPAEVAPSAPAGTQGTGNR